MVACSEQKASVPEPAHGFQQKAEQMEMATCFQTTNCPKRVAAEKTVSRNPADAGAAQVVLPAAARDLFDRFQTNVVAPFRPPALAASAGHFPYLFGAAKLRPEDLSR